MEDRIGIAPARWLQAAKKIEAHLGDPRLSEDYLRFRMELAKAYADILQLLDQKARPVPEAKAAGSLQAKDINFDLHLLKRLFSAVVTSRSGRAPAGEEMAAILEWTEKQPQVLAQIAELSIFEWDGEAMAALSAKMGVQIVTLLALGRMLAVPFIMDAIKGRAALDKSEAEQTTCPVCGSAPALARLSPEEGQRVLICSICETEWSFPRIMCPFCKNTAQDTLSTIVIPESEARWIEVCDACKRYIKTIDERKLPQGAEVMAFVEETVCLPLDLLAEREGYGLSCRE